jgi:hypothetical protein
MSLFIILNDLHHFAITVLLAIGALLPIVGPLDGAPIYLAMTSDLSPEERVRMAKAVAVNSFILAYLLGSDWCLCARFLGAVNSHCPGCRRDRRLRHRMIAAEQS